MSDLLADIGGQYAGWRFDSTVAFTMEDDTLLS
jgi:hypothetical protein